MLLGYLRGLHPPCDVDRLCDQMAPEIKGSVVVMMTDRNDNNSLQRCGCLRGTSLGVLSVGFGLFFRRVIVYWIMATEGAALVENRAGITFGVELYVPWDASEAVVDIHSEGVVPLGSIPHVIGLTGRRPDAAESRILQGRDFFLFKHYLFIEDFTRLFRTR